MEIKTTLEKLVRKFRTRNPFELADALSVAVVYEELGTIRGYYSQSFRHKYIHINYDLPEHMKKFVCAHELGHAVLHPNANTPFLRENTLFSIGRLEKQANTFATLLLLPDDVLRDYADYHYTIPQIAVCSGLPVELVEYRINHGGR